MYSIGSKIFFATSLNLPTPKVTIATQNCFVLSKTKNCTKLMLLIFFSFSRWCPCKVNAWSKRSFAMEHTIANVLQQHKRIHFSLTFSLIWNLVPLHWKHRRANKNFQKGWEKWASLFPVNTVLNLSDKSLVTSKCGKHKKVAHEAFWHHLLPFVEQVHGNTESIC